MADLFFDPHACNSTAVLSSTGPVHSGDNCTASRHGTAAAYRRGCRCEVARRAIAHYENERNLDVLRGRSRTLSNLGAIRRLHALRALGYTSRDLAARIGVDERNIARWPHRRWITRAHHDAIVRVYTELADTRGPDERARRHAARQGWLPPLWWDDDTLDDPDLTNVLHGCPKHSSVIDQVAIDRYLDGDHTITLTRAEKATALRQLVAKGDTPATAGGRLGINSVHARRYAAAVPPHVDEADVHRSSAVLSPDRPQDRRATEKTSVGPCNRADNDHLEETG